MAKVHVEHKESKFRASLEQKEWDGFGPEEQGNWNVLPHPDEENAKLFEEAFKPGLPKPAKAETESKGKKVG